MNSRCVPPTSSIFVPSAGGVALPQPAERSAGGPEAPPLPAVGGNSARLIGDYRGSIDAMAADIDTATRFVHVEFFIVALDDTTKGFFAAMERAVQRGVVVRLLLDYVASKRVSVHAATIAELAGDVTRRERRRGTGSRAG